ncbi:MAG TPA: uroporphyrinogen-III C-methyltransferase [Bryobacteraceae bacterium]|jgi:uroporphyrin-III C-methyltransferase|nr:uroporphyrinogen-III C-methyltransferase [Bryobacteraceae bacterium]
MVLTPRTGKLYLIGAGPGDPELLTLKAVRALGESDVVLYDRLVDEAVLRHARKDAEIVYVGKHHGEQEKTQAEIFNLIRVHAEGRKIVARLKGGDPMVFGRGAEEWALALEHGMEVELIPGVTSVIAVPALAGIPVTYRKISQSFAVITGHGYEGSPQEWRRFAVVGTLIILMGVKNRVGIAQALIDAGRSENEPAAFVERGTTDRARVIECTLGAIAQGMVLVENPAVLVVGEVVRVRRRLKPRG